MPGPVLLVPDATGLAGDSSCGSSRDASVTPTVPLRVIVRRFWPYGRRFRRWVVVTFGLSMVEPLLTAAVIWVFKEIVDEVLTPADLSALPSLALLFAAVTVAAGALSFVASLLSAWLSGKFLLGARQDFYLHLLEVGPSVHERQRPGDVLARLGGDLSVIEQFVLTGLAKLVSNCFRVVLYTVMLVLLSWQLALLALLVAPLFGVVARRFSRAIKEASRERRRRVGTVQAVAEETLANLPLVQAYNAQPREARRFAAEAEASFRADMRAARLTALFGPTVDMVELAGGLAVIWLGTWQIAAGNLTVGALLAFLAFLAQLYDPVRSLGNLSNTVFAASASAERVIELLDEPTLDDELPGEGRPVPGPGAIRLEAVSYTYPGTARPALDHVSLDLQPGESVMLVGDSGAGKSTLVRLILRLADPDHGRVLVDGVDLRSLDHRAHRDRIAVLLQESLVLDGTVEDNIRYGRPDATPERITAAARAADADEFIRALPDGYRSRLGQRGRRLSGGQRQRIAIARALVRDAPILVLDEPTTGLDAASSDRILDPLVRLMRGRTTVVVSHNLQLGPIVDRVVVLGSGRVIEVGSHHELLAAGGAYAELCRLATGGGEWSDRLPGRSGRSGRHRRSSLVKDDA